MQPIRPARHTHIQHTQREIERVCATLFYETFYGSNKCVIYCRFYFSWHGHCYSFIASFYIFLFYYVIAYEFSFSFKWQFDRNLITLFVFFFFSFWLIKNVSSEQIQQHDCSSAIAMKFNQSVVLSRRLTNVSYIQNDFENRFCSCIQFVRYCFYINNIRSTVRRWRRTFLFWTRTVRMWH